MRKFYLLSTTVFKWIRFFFPLTLCLFIITGTFLSSYPIQALSNENLILEEPPQSATTLYLLDRFQRQNNGRKVQTNDLFASPGLFDNSSAITPQNAYRWPSIYLRVSDDRTDSNSNGKRECRIKIDLSGFSTSGVYSAEEVLGFENEIRRIVDMYNTALAFVGLEF
jgi:hypothetical protein